MVTPTQRFNEYGPFIPFDRPIVPIATGIFDEPSLAICVNEDWIPVVVGALKSLLSDGTWKTDDPDVAANLTEQVDELISSWDNCGISMVIPDWHMNIFVTDGFADFYREVPDHNDTTQVANFTIFTGRIVANTEPPEPLHYYIQMFDNPTESPCGGKVIDFRFLADSVIEAIHLSITDCLDFVTTWDGFGEANFADVFPMDPYKEIKEIEVITSTQLMTYYVRGVELLTCVSA